MKKSTVLLGAIFLLMATFAGLFFVGGRLTARLNVLTANASEYPRAFQSIQAVLAEGDAPQRFSEEAPADAAGYRLENVTITLANRGFFDAEWVSVEVERAPGDVAVYSFTGEGSTIRARSTGTVNLKLIARAEGSGPRTYHIQYYVYGLKRTITVVQ